MREPGLPDDDPRRASGRELGLLLASAFVLRLALAFVLDTPALAEQGDAWTWGAESVCLAKSMLAHGTYGDPWCQGTGASSWLTPPYPALLAGILALFGGVGRASAWALVVVQSALSAWTCLWIRRLGERLELGPAGRWAGWLWAVYPLALWNASKTVWDTTAVAWALTGFLLVLVGPRARPPRPLRAGLAYGALLFLNPAPLALAPVAWAWLARGARTRRAALRGALVFSLAAFAVCLPWMLRNRRVLGTFALRPNLGVELRIGNHDEASGHPVPFKYHPSGVAEELALYRELGEVGYGEENMQRALDWIRGHPAAFLALTLKRVQLFWVGNPPTLDTRREGDIEPGGDWNSWLKWLAFLSSGLLGAAGLLVARGRPGARPLLASSLVLFGGPYYVTHVSERYRFPIDPLLILLCACFLVWAAARVRARTGVE